MRKNILIRVLSLIAAMSCVVVMLCACSKDKEKKEKEKSEKSEPKSKYAMDVGEFEGKEGEDYTNQVFLFSGIVEKFHASDSDVYGVTFILKSEDENVKDVRSFTIRNVLEDVDIESMEQAAVNKSKVYILATSITSGVDDKESTAIVRNVENKYRIYGSKSKIFQSDSVDIETIDKAYEEEKEYVEKSVSSISSVSEAIDAVLNGSIDINKSRNITYSGMLDSKWLLEYEKNVNNFSYDSDKYRKNFYINGEEKTVIIKIYESDKIDINDIPGSGLTYNVEFKLSQYSGSAILEIEEGTIGINVYKFLD